MPYSEMPYSEMPWSEMPWSKETLEDLEAEYLARQDKTPIQDILQCEGEVLKAILSNEVGSLREINWLECPELSKRELQGRFNSTALLDGIANSSNDAVLHLLNHCPFMADQVNTHSSAEEKGIYAYLSNPRPRNTPLILSVSKGWNHVDGKRAGTPHAQVIAKLIEMKAEVNEVDDNKCTALHYACLHRDINAIGLLLSAGARTDVRNKHGNYPIDYLFFDKSKVQKILVKVTGSSTAYTLDESQFQSESALCPILSILFPHEDPRIVLAKQQFLNAATQGNLEGVKKYMDINQHNTEALNVRDQSQNTALIKAIYFGRLEVVRQLLKNPLIQIDPVNKYGYDAIKYVRDKKGKQQWALLELFTSRFKEFGLPGEEIASAAETPVYIHYARLPLSFHHKKQPNEHKPTKSPSLNQCTVS